jgi:hypothetical protein
MPAVSNRLLSNPTSALTGEENNCFIVNFALYPFFTSNYFTPINKTGRGLRGRYAHGTLPQGK